MTYLLRTCFLCLTVLTASVLSAVNLTFEVDMSQMVANNDFDPATEFVDIAGTFNDWGTTLIPLQEGDEADIWLVSIPNFTAGESIEFKFRLNGTWGGREEFPGAGNNRVLQVPAQDDTVRFTYNVRAAGPTIPDSERDTSELDWWNDAVFYEIFVRSFYDSDGNGIGDFEGLTQKLDYLNDGDPTTDTDLGIDGIWLMPINPSPSYHGYDVTDYRGINPQYGSMDDFKAFIQAAHDRGIRVIIDYVLNHSSTQHPWFVSSRSGAGSAYQDWYRWSATNPGYNGPWGQTVWHNWGGEYYYGVFWGGMPDLNYEHPPVKNEVLDIASFWLNEVGVDGFRLDAVKYLYENGSATEDQQETFDFFADFRAHYKAQNPASFAVGEAWTSTEKVVPYVENDRLDFCFDFDLATSILSSVNSGDPNALAFQVQRSYDAYPYLQLGSFLTNHDQNRLMNVVGGNADRVKVAAGLYLTLPGVPFLYYGEEIGMLGAKPDENIRLPMQWSDAPNAGFTSGTPWRGVNSNYASYNVADQQTQAGSMWRQYRDLIKARKANPALRRGYYRELSVDNPSVFAFMRYWEGDTALVLANLSNQPTGTLTLTLPETPAGNKTLFNYLASANIEVSISQDGEVTLNSLAGYETRIYGMGAKSVSTNEPLSSGISIFPNPTQGDVTIQWEGSEFKAASYRILDMQGRICQQGKLPDLPSFTLELDSLTTGLYLIEVEGRESSWREKIIVE